MLRLSHKCVIVHIATGFLIKYADRLWALKNPVSAPAVGTGSERGEEDDFSRLSRTFPTRSSFRSHRSFSDWCHCHWSTLIFEFKLFIQPGFSSCRYHHRDIVYIQPPGEHVAVGDPLTAFSLNLFVHSNLLSHLLILLWFMFNEEHTESTNHDDSFLNQNEVRVSPVRLLILE